MYMNELKMYKEPRFLSHLLPYDPQVKKHERLKDGLHEYLLLLVLAEEAMVAFREEELYKFDPLVGENSCQIRALKISLISSDNSFDISETLEKIVFARKSVNELLELVSINSIDQNKSLQCFLNIKSIDVELNCDLMFLIKSYILSIVKVPCEKKILRKEKTITKRIKSFGKVGSTFSDNFIRLLREKLSKSSFEFICKISNSPVFLEQKMNVIMNEFSILHKGLHCTPFYWMTKIIIEQAAYPKFPSLYLPNN